MSRRIRKPHESVYSCSFCGKNQDHVKRLIAGPGAVCICDACVELCREIIEGDDGTQPHGTERMMYGGIEADQPMIDEEVPDQEATLHAAEAIVEEALRKQEPLVGIIMGSKSDWETMQNAAEALDKLGVPYEVRVVSAHRTPDLLFEYAENAERRGLRVIIAGAGGAAHLPGMCAAKTVLPVLGVPVESKALKGIDSLLSIAQMPAGIPVGTLAIGRAGAVNAALLAAAILATNYPEIRAALHKFRAELP